MTSQGWLWRASSEEPSNRHQRLARQLDVLGQLEADVIALQEVNPLPIRAFWYAERLNKRVFFAAANQGIKCGWGPPFNWNEGVALLVPSHWRAEYLGKLSLPSQRLPRLFELSGEVASLFSFQFSPTRVAVAVRLHLPKERLAESFCGAASVVIATTQLNPGHGATSEASSIVRDFQESGYIKAAEAEETLSLLRRANALRMQESERLSDWLSGLALPGEAVVLCGDLCASETEAPLQTLSAAGYRDVWPLCNGSLGGKTWDPAHNEMAFRSQTSDRTDKHYGRGVATVMRRLALLPRRLDYVLVRPWDHAASHEPGVGEPLLSREQDPAALGYRPGSLSELGSFGRAARAWMFPGPTQADSRQAVVSSRFGVCADFDAGCAARESEKP